MGRNIELKARLADIDSARAVAAQLVDEGPQREHQIDTYFYCTEGRLKLREIVGQTCQLIWYARPDESGPKPSDYRIVTIAEAGPLKSLLSEAIGVRAVVDKRREIFLYRNVRIHLDQVENLGSFLEFEAVLGPQAEQDEGYRLVEALSARFSLSPGDLLVGSYGDIIEQTGASR